MSLIDRLFAIREAMTTLNAGVPDFFVCYVTLKNIFPKFFDREILLCINIFVLQCTMQKYMYIDDAIN